MTAQNNGMWTAATYAERHVGWRRRPVVAWGVRLLGRGRYGPRVSADSGGATLTTTTTSTAIVPFDPVFADPKRLALGGFLAGYSAVTRNAYELDLRQYIAWCDDHDVDLFQARRADIEEFARELERRGTARRSRDGCAG